MATARHEPVKVVLIDTKYVETDQMSFKSVVQSLTGKDSCVAWIEESSESFVGRKRSRTLTVASGGLKKPRSGGEVALMLTKDNSLKEFEKLLLDLPPPVEELHWLWAD
ncbi:hypothetical protein L1049_009678 [Liquidambar formosana]|uniref:VQ domain-containing protein n=1 Tax=Liquidambar formosana TaxID=63359 RepID=A0AAP0R6C6_LIQFO